MIPHHLSSPPAPSIHPWIPRTRCYLLWCLCYVHGKLTRGSTEGSVRIVAGCAPVSSNRSSSHCLQVDVSRVGALQRCPSVPPYVPCLRRDCNAPRSSSSHMAGPIPPWQLEVNRWERREVRWMMAGLAPLEQPLGPCAAHKPGRQKCAEMMGAGTRNDVLPPPTWG